MRLSLAYGEGCTWGEADLEAMRKEMLAWGHAVGVHGVTSLRHVRMHDGIGSLMNGW